MKGNNEYIQNSFMFSPTSMPAPTNRQGGDPFNAFPDQSPWIQPRPGPPVHGNIHCNNCKCMPIVGLRYKCGICNDFDLCQYCFDTAGHNASHLFVVVRRPIPGNAARMLTLPDVYQQQQQQQPMQQGFLF